MKVLFHLDETEKWSMTLANVKNFLHEVPDAHITVVANGPAVKYYTTDAIEADLLAQVDFVACNNALKANTIQPPQINTAVRIVNAGVVEIARKQKEGYAYIRP
ncbi:DsrE family protein [Fundicoccus culcitae]|uniref:DsrE family protein n=1 Tax=Fundicoccus culcitae TaxID=2969821 RepID=A0ABY5P7T4_9LACT|nr:DsrE family protein [Fundicoccus culcitae]UUX34797.1 DsrE family protein [Fundicoccus culcitae]